MYFKLWDFMIAILYLWFYSNFILYSFMYQSFLRDLPKTGQMVGRKM